MAAEKACKSCRAVFTGSKCPKCGSTEFIDSFKGKVIILNTESSEIAKSLGLKEKGEFAVRLR
ncbi:hypothetical protein CO038_01590 [Candidatus Pacearchaeota archaeon CG_4_9_14_0_2_um_filter_39_13]|nr:hypothetical protein [Candidatus Pacearchaeota archaeon]OIO42451.1 MAG: hypothetical protein AUJ64_04030 [Candidatus Pacearchaeota archaeon CG1_02_39_14]PJC44824.1 MAG: hypothetical protein CO038_01590 [Candidatus Pacearchaeota archaeon CG_4_9_14_0_2_um_filter_39_13]